MLFRVSVVLICLSVCAAAADFPSPAGKGSQTPYLRSANGELYLTWLEALPDQGHALKFSIYDGKSWSAPGVIVSGVPFFVNWADFPSMLVLENGMFVAHWLQKSGKGTYAYDVMISTSTDRGKTWSPAVRPHRDKVQGEHGFVSLIPSGRDAFTALWLDGRKTGGGHGSHSKQSEMQLMASTYENGQFQPELLIDGRVCDCCQTSAAVTKSGAIAVYRDRSATEVRDISVVTMSNGKWSAPRDLSSDQWKIAACPVNGPSLATAGDNVAVVWFTAAGDRPKVHALFSSDGGKTFGKPVRVDLGKPTGRVDVVWLKDGSALVSWLENTGKGADVMTRKIRPDGSSSQEMVIAPSTTARASGFPRMAAWQNGAVIAWTHVGDDGNSIRLSMIE